MEINLQKYDGQEEKAISLIQGFWLAHNDYVQSTEEAKEDLISWTGKGHEFYFVKKDGVDVGFVHMGNRGAQIDWLEDLFILPDYQNQGIGSYAVKAMEELVKKYSDSLYIEAAARNEAAIRLYRKLGYNCLNTITIRKDFEEEKFDVIRTEKVYEQEFEIRKVKQENQ